MASRSPRWRLQTYPLGDFTVVRLVGEAIVLGEEDALWLRAQLLRLVGTGSVRLAVDLGNISYLTSTTAETFLTHHRKLKELGGRLSLYHLTPPVAEVVAVLHLSEVLDVRLTPLDEILRN